MRRMLLIGALALASVALVAPGTALAAPWCGTVAAADRPATVGGAQIRVVYAIASDGLDRSAQIAPQLSADVDEVSAWWQGQDPTRVPRFDLVGFPCGAQADITLVRLAQPNAELDEQADVFALVADQAIARDASFGGLKYVIYLDVPQRDPDLCGVGGGSFEGIGAAIVFLSACTDIANPLKLTHELLHSLGALPAGAPHPCPDDLGHPCDSTTDILYPYAEPSPLSAYALDVGRDDYYGHVGAWNDIQDVRWLRRLDAQVGLTVDVKGSGRVVSDVPGVDCATASCAAQWDSGALVELTAKPAAGKRFVRWSGGCASEVSECDLTLSQATQVSALFAPASFSLRTKISGRGRIVDRVSLRCASDCTKRVRSFSSRELKAVPAPGWALKSWSGACRSRKRRSTCSVPMTATTTVGASFVRKRATR